MSNMNDAVFWAALKEYNQNGTPVPKSVVEWAKNWPDKAIHLATITKSRIVESEPNILEAVKNSSIHFQSVISYCTKVLGGRWIELENLLLSGCNVDDIISYSAHLMKGRWVEGEALIKDARNIIAYSRSVLHRRWKEKEKIILQDPRSVYEYCLYVINPFENENRWKEGEDVILNSEYVDKYTIICNYAKYIIRGPWKEGEEHVKKSPSAAFFYSLDVLGKRWPEGEKVIAKEPSWAHRYAVEVLKGSFPLAENSLLSSRYYFEYFTFSTAVTRDLVEKLANQFDPNMTVNEILQKVNDGRNKDFENKVLNSTHNQKKAVWYATNVLKSRWPEAEKIIKKSSKWSVVYARDVIKGRWEDGEKTISKDPKYLAQYGIEVIKGQLSNVLHNILVAEKLKNNNVKIDKYFEMLNEQDANNK